MLWCSSVVSKTEYLGQPALQFVVHDVTSERRALDVSARLLEEARDAVRVRDEFLSVAAHELKTPLTNLRGYAQLLRSKGASDQQRLESGLEVIDRQAAKLARLVDRLLDLSLLEHGRIALEPGPIDLVTIIRDAVAAVAPPATTRVELDLPPTLPLVGDALRLEQVVTNLIENAAKHGASEHPARVRAWATGTGHVVFEVADRGPGIPAEDRERIFDRYFKGVGTLHSGLGLGLPLSREIVHRHGGTIVVVASEGRGTCVRVTLPTGGEEVPP